MKDNFSMQAELYEKYRPSYPEELFEFIAELVKERSLAWDCGTGNGQSARVLSRMFRQVYATDISEKQLAHAFQAPNIEYAVEPAESCKLPDQSVDLICISQALHWFDPDRFYAEVRRVARPGALIAAWTYSLLTISPEIDAMISRYHYETLEAYWDPERKYVNEHYRTIAFPFEDLRVPEFQIDVEWSIEELKGYVQTWSAEKKWLAAEGVTQLDSLFKDIAQVWGPVEKRQMHFPIHLRAGYID